MNSLLKIARSASPSTGVQFRREAYGSRGIRRFLRDVLAMANAAVEGSRYIITGADVDARGNKSFRGVASDDFSGKPSYQALVSEFIEPPIRIRYQAVNLDGKSIGVYEIADCQDKPYMMRVDQSEKLRRGDAYTRQNDLAVKMGRRQLQEMFERKFRDSVSADRIEIGFPGEIIHKEIRLSTVDLTKLPSAIAAAKLRELLDIQMRSRNSGSTTVMARLTHARLFGSDLPYETRSPDELMREMELIERKYRDDNEHFLFEHNAQKVQLVVYNQGDEPIQNASLTLVMPNHNAFYVAQRLPRLTREGDWVDRGPDEHSNYPAVHLKDDAVYVSSTLGAVPVNSPVTAFRAPLRICVGKELRGRRLGIRYSLFGSNLREPAKGKLRFML